MSHEQLSDVKQIYDERSEVYDDSFHPQQAQDIIELAQLKPGQSVLDLACGTGLVANLAKKAVGKTGKVIGVDISGNMLAKAKSKAVQAGLDVTWFEGDIADLSNFNLHSQIERGFDFITCIAALVLLHDPLSAVRHWKTLLAPGGRIITDVPLPDCFESGHILQDVAHELVGSKAIPYDRSWITGPDSVKQLFADAGFEVEKLVISDSYFTEDFSVDDAESIFDKTTSNPMFNRLREPHVVDKARALFAAKWVEQAGPKGRVKSEARLYVAVARAL
ncbi:MAG: hypothetical protein M4579_000281 [Chaenotheca gracillima]|nr:MAG: hypothetical protein M4579_000281 [Chaenotheca gracillima]